MATHPQALTVHLGIITASEAAQAYATLDGMAPDGTTTPDGAAAAGASFVIGTETGSCVFTLSASDGLCWIHAAQGTGYDMTAPTFEVIERLARRAGCHRVGFATLRRGLVRRARSLGYRIEGTTGHGHHLEKTL